MKACFRCKEVKSSDDFYLNKRQGTPRSNCKTCHAILRKEYYITNKSRELEKSSIWYRNNIDRANKTKLEYKNKRRAVDPLYRKIEYARSYLYKIIQNISLYERDIKKLKCTRNALKRHFESKFRDGMTWENHGKVWQVDHIIPLSSARTLEEVDDLNVLSNLQPLLIKENVKKRSNL